MKLYKLDNLGAHWRRSYLYKCVCRNVCFVKIKLTKIIPTKKLKVFQIRRLFCAVLESQHKSLKESKECCVIHFNDIELQGANKAQN